MMVDSLATTSEAGSGMPVDSHRRKRDDGNNGIGVQKSKDSQRRVPHEVLVQYGIPLDKRGRKRAIKVLKAFMSQQRDTEAELLKPILYADIGTQDRLTLADLQHHLSIVDESTSLRVLRIGGTYRIQGVQTFISALRGALQNQNKSQ